MGESEWSQQTLDGCQWQTIWFVKFKSVSYIYFMNHWVYINNFHVVNLYCN
jgi:hypothetical protein